MSFLLRAFWFCDIINMVMKMEDKYPERKPTRIKNYDYSCAGAYFVTICTQDRKQILSEIKRSNNTSVSETDGYEVGDGAHDVPKVHLTQIGKIVEKYLLSSENIQGVKIDKYVIMPDHIHAIIFIGKESKQNGTSRAPSPTNEMLPHIISTFKRFCNKEIGYNIFQRSFADHIIRDNDDYETRRKYIHENPKRWYYKNI